MAGRTKGKDKRGVNRAFTFMIVPERSAHVRRFRFTKRMLYWVTGSLLVSLVTFGVMVWMAGSVPRLSEENQRLNGENLELKQRLQRVAHQLAHISDTLDRVERFDAKLRAITQLNDPDRHIAMGPVSRREMAAVQGTDGSAPQYAEDGLEYGAAEELSPVQLDLRLDNVRDEARRRERSLRELQELLADQRSLLRSLPSIWPTRGWVTSGFGPRVSPFTGERAMHEGIDVATAAGAEILAPADGVIVFSGTRGGYGKMLILDHGYGVETRYGHNAENLVTVGQKVKRGQKIATVGNTGRSTGPHLHYEVRLNGIPENPRRYILE